MSTIRAANEGWACIMHSRLPKQRALSRCRQVNWPQAPHAGAAFCQAFGASFRARNQFITRLRRRLSAIKIPSATAPECLAARFRQLAPLGKNGPTRGSTSGVPKVRPVRLPNHPRADGRWPAALPRGNQLLPNRNGPRVEIWGRSESARPTAGGEEIGRPF
jgi:hypothetical protein